MPEKELTSGRTLARNSMINFIGQFLPMVVAFFCIPFLIHTLGTDRFGIITLVWMVIGYFSLFDLGLGRALTQVVAEKIGKSEEENIPQTVWTALLIMLGLGIVGGVVLFTISHWLTYAVLKIPPALQAETFSAVAILSLSLPTVLISSAMSGFLSALQKFTALNYVKVPSGIFNFVGPVCVALLSHNLFWITAVIAFGRLLSCIAYVVVSVKVYKPLRTYFLFDLKEIRPLFRLGGWMTVTNIISPILTQVDRFVIGATMSVSAVAYYATPYDVVTKLWIIPTALAGVIFPAFATNFVQSHAHTQQLFMRSSRIITLLLFPVIVLINCFAPEILTLWLDPVFASHSTTVLQIIAVGVYCNSMGMVFSCLVQGIGRPDLTAKIHIIELPVYLVLLWFAIHHFGIIGAAIAWTIRVAMDSTLLLFLADHFFSARFQILRRLVSIALTAVVLMLLPVAVAPLWGRTIIFVVLAGIYVLAVTFLLDDGERLILKQIKNKICTKVRG